MSTLFHRRGNGTPEVRYLIQGNQVSKRQNPGKNLGRLIPEAWLLVTAVRGRCEGHGRMRRGSAGLTAGFPGVGAGTSVLTCPRAAGHVSGLTPSIPFFSPPPCCCVHPSPLPAFAEVVHVLGP